MKKAQVAYEFMMIFFVLAAGFTTWLAFASSIQTDIQKTKNLENMKDYSLSLKHEIYVISQMHDGFTKTIELPPTIEGQQYKITLEHVKDIENIHNFSTIYITSEDIGFYTHFDINLMNGLTELSPGEKITLTKNQSTIDITQ